MNVEKGHSVNWINFISMIRSKDEGISLGVRSIDPNNANNQIL